MLTIYSEWTISACAGIQDKQVFLCLCSASSESGSDDVLEQPVTSLVPKAVRSILPKKKKTGVKCGT